MCHDNVGQQLRRVPFRVQDVSARKSVNVWDGLQMLDTPMFHLPPTCDELPGVYDGGAGGWPLVQRRHIVCIPAVKRETVANFSSTRPAATCSLTP